MNPKENGARHRGPAAHGVAVAPGGTMQIFADAKFDFIGKRAYSLIFSLIFARPHCLT